MKFKVLWLPVMALSISTAFGQAVKTYQIKSPDGKLVLSVSAGKNIIWAVKHKGTDVIIPSEISLTTNNNEILGKNTILKKAEKDTVYEIFDTKFYKKNNVTDNYNQLTLTFKGEYGLVFRAFNNGVAYRFFIRRKGDITILNEEANFNFKEDYKAYLPFVNDPRNKDRFNNSFEAHYDLLNLSKIKKDTLAFLPVLVDAGSPIKAAILEADLQDYPGMYVTPGEQNNLHGVFAAYPSEEGLGGYNNINYVVSKRENFIAKTSGSRNFPWRLVVISDEDKQLADNDLVQCLSEPSKIKDDAWIKPGKVAWDWWNDWNITHVNFKAGINVETYKYYIDFALANKLTYMIIDEGWSDDHDLNQNKIDIQQIVDYGKEKGIGVILWATWYSITRDTEGLFAKFEQMGVKGFKIDFIDRDDQKAVSSLYEIAQKAAAHHLVVDYHGMYKPSGIQRTFPNIINCEGVKGLENMKWGTDNQPGYDVSIPFIRMLSGPMDYTPGGMRNASKSDFRPVNSNPMTQGTRCHQLAMYTVFEAPLQMLADNPTIYKQEQESTDFIDAMPTTFDATTALDGKVGEYVSIARRKGTTWFAGVMTNWDARDINMNLSFLGAGTYKAIIFEDGINANKDAADYTTKTLTVTAKDNIAIKMASGGGWAARFEKIN